MKTYELKDGNIASVGDIIIDIKTAEKKEVEHNINLVDCGSKVLTPIKYSLKIEFNDLQIVTLRNKAELVVFHGYLVSADRVLKQSDFNPETLKSNIREELDIMKIEENGEIVFDRGSYVTLEEALQEKREQMNQSAKRLQEAQSEYNSLCEMCNTLGIIGKSCKGYQIVMTAEQINKL